MTGGTGRHFVSAMRRRIALRVICRRILVLSGAFSLAVVLPFSAVAMESAGGLDSRSSEDKAAAGTASLPEQYEQSCTASGGKRDFLILYQFTKLDKGRYVPRLDELGLRLGKISYERRLGVERVRDGKRLPAKQATVEIEVPSRRILERAAGKITEEGDMVPRSMTILDIEAWHIDHQVSDELAQLSAGKYISVIRQMRELLPGRSFGNYGLPVYRDRKAIKDGPSSTAYLDWQKRNGQMQALADELDVFHPTLYTFELEDFDYWQRYASAHVLEARKLASRRQPVVPFIWPQYHNRSRYSGRFLSKEFWRLQLETMLNVADGVFIWSNQKSLGDETDGWWQATTEFVRQARDDGISINACID